MENQQLFAADDDVGEADQMEFGILNGKFMWELLHPDHEGNNVSERSCAANTTYYQRVVAKKDENTYNCYYKELNDSTWTLDMSGVK